MKKYLVLLLITTSITMFIIVDGCKHHLPVNYCLTQPIHLSTSFTDATGSQNNGTIHATALGGNHIQYSLNGSSFQDSGYFYGLAALTAYKVTAKNSWGCIDTSWVVINSINPCAGVSVVVSYTKTDASINTSNGTINASAIGGTGFSYSLNGGAYQALGTFVGLSAGNYTVFAKNSNGCIGSINVTISAFDPCLGVTILISTSKTDPITGQTNGTITATATGGTGFSYSLNGGVYQTSGLFTSLGSGNYTVSAKNSNGCIGTSTVSLGSTNPCLGVNIVVNLTKTDPTIGVLNGTITATASGGTGFTYSLDGITFQTSNTFIGLAAGTYIVTSKSASGCIGSATITLVAINPCSSINIIVSVTITNVTPCITPINNGVLNIMATGSNGFTYSLNGGAYQSSNIFNNLATGSYTITVKDANGCTKTTTATISTIAMGPLFTNVRSLISTRCSGSGCHIGNGNNASGYNFDADCNIVTYWSQIKGSCVTYTLNQMPKPPQPTPLTATEKAMITNWVNAGHRFTD